MRLNPEFRRNLWLDLSVQRLIAMPAILGAMFYLVHLSDDDLNPLGSFAIWIYFLLILFWGTRLSAASVVTEVRDGTWDWQRMSAIGPWQMTWGKLFGSTIFVWYGALIALGVALVSDLLHGQGQTVPRLLFVSLASGILAHAVSLAASLLWLRRGAPTRRAVLLMPQLLGLLAGGLAASRAFELSALAGVLGTSQNWYGLTFDRGQFELVSLAIFLTWSVLGVYRLMQAELQVRQRPWAWGAFVLFLMVYYAGMPEPRQAGAALSEVLVMRLMLGFGVALIMAYVSIFLFAKDVIGLRGLSLALAAGDVGRALRLLPPWLIATVIAGLAGLVLIVVATMSEAVAATEPSFTMDVRLARVLLILGTLGYLLRDLGIMLLLHLRGTSKRADAAALVYLLVLHVLVPSLMTSAGLEEWVSLVSPFVYWAWLPLVFVAQLGLGDEYAQAARLTMDIAPWMLLIGAVVQGALVLLLLTLRWRRFQSDFETSLAHEGV